MQVADPLTRHIIGKYCLPSDWFDVRKKLPNFVINGELKTINVMVRHADGREEATIYTGFGNFGYHPYFHDVTHWKVLPQSPELYALHNSNLETNVL